MNKDKTVTVIDHITLDRLQQLKVCIACQIFFCEWSGANIIEKIISLNDESLLQILKTNYQASVTNENKYNSFCEILNQNYMLFQNKTSLCSCCLGCNDMSYVKELAIKICKLFHEKIEQKERIFLFIELTIPPIIDIFRVIVRTLGTRNTRKSSSFPIFDHIILKMLSIELLRLSDNLIEIKSDIYESVHHIIINGIIYNQLEFYDCIFGNSIIQKKTKRMRMELSNDTLDNSIINRVNVDRGLLQMKDYNKDSILNDLGTKFSSFVETDLHQRMHFDITHNISPIYILGRYLKYSRDLPQSPWLVGETREMKSSIEDIIGSAIKLVLHNESSKLHGCGREDIDVRCLGNGRPFVMEINKALYELSSEKIDQIMNLLKDKDQVNIQGHLSITWMKQVNRSVWESMQQLAEEKKKGYCCLVWTEKSITQEDLNYLGSISSSIHGIDIDEDGRHCLKIAQKTPLRVLHRRSLLTRERFIYNIQTHVLGDHFFMMKLVTSSGAYVKEFVHGDCGRCEPNICTLLNSRTDILQLDVIGLFDSFEDGYEETVLDTKEYYDNQDWYELKDIYLSIINSVNSN